MIEKIAEFFSTCPELSESGVMINYLDKEPFSAALIMCGEDTLEAEYTDGGQRRCEKFILAIRQEYSGANSQNSSAAKRCEAIEQWVKAQNDSENLPQFDSLISVLSVSIGKGFEITQTGSVDARFEAEIKVVYFMEK
ncbi:MAG: hypothetical protein J6D15_05730 [Clostridia bacterium]|nr:hypothetical protein [Clostridia bacterium]